MRELHVSHVETFIRCEQEYELAVLRAAGVRGYISALAVGGAIHAAGAALREGRDAMYALASASMELQRRGVAELPAEGQALEAAKVFAMVHGYINRWAGDMLLTSVNEMPFRTWLRNPTSGRRSKTFALAGTVDALILQGDAWSLYEMKSTSDTLDETEAYLREGIQIPTYDVGVQRDRGLELQSNVVDLIKKPTAKRRKAESPMDWARRCIDEYRADPDRYFRRVEIPIEEARMRQAEALLWRVAERIRQADRVGYLAARGWSCCKRASGWCRMKALCWYGADIDEQGDNDGNASNDETTEHAA